ncbi:MAG: hypothetical protein A2234_02870 [Elusimicrobia bacterium RIFOXYA2_FULL_58_8]|nr:MAG: hypothetical protein A2234_02870 [Elusimicrobia bacterium RIFOXYA2_FULL_58_8]
MGLMWLAGKVGNQAFPSRGPACSISVNEKYGWGSRSGEGSSVSGAHIACPKPNDACKKRKPERIVFLIISAPQKASLTSNCRPPAASAQEAKGPAGECFICGGF